MTRPELPATVAIELSSSCHLRCVHCDKRYWSAFGGERASPFMDLGLFRSLVDEIATSRKTAVTLSYEGESLLHPGILEALEYMEATRVRPWLTTTLEGARDELLEALVRTCSVVSVSLALSDASFQETRGPIQILREAEDRLQRLLSLRTTVPSAARIAVNAVLPGGVPLGSPGVAAFARRWMGRADDIQVWFEMAYGREIRHLHRGGVSRHLARRRVCVQPWNYVAVLSDGTVSPCCVTSRVRLPGVTARRGLADALEQPAYREFLARQASRQLDGMPCVSCDCWLDDWLGDETVPVAPGLSARVAGFTATLHAEGGAP